MNRLARPRLAFCVLAKLSVIIVHGDFVCLGIWLHVCGLLTASPDGIVTQSLSVSVLPSCSDIGSADLVEVKYPYAARDMSISAAGVRC